MRIGIMILVLCASGAISCSQPARADNEVRTSASRNDNQWRYKFHDGRWWYWQPNNSWVMWNGNNWIPQRAAGQHWTGYRGNYGNANGLYDGYGYYGRPYNSGYYGPGYYGPGYGPGYYYSPGAATGANIGGAIGAPASALRSAAHSVDETGLRFTTLGKGRTT